MPALPTDKDDRRALATKMVQLWGDMAKADRVRAEMAKGTDNESHCVAMAADSAERVQWWTAVLEATNGND